MKQVHIQTGLSVMRTSRLLLLVTHGCCLRCRYCFVAQDEKKLMDENTIMRSVDFLMTSSAQNLQIQYFGGEPLMLPFKSIKRSILYARRQAAKKQRKLDILITTNGVLLNKKDAGFLKKEEVILEISLDGSPQAQKVNRPQNPGAPDSYELIVRNLPVIFSSGIDCRASMVVTPFTVDGLVENFIHLTNLGFRKIFIMTGLGVNWTEKALRSLRRNLQKLEALYLAVPREERIQLLNLTEWFSPFRMNTEVSVDYDGHIYSACISYLVHNKKRKKRFILGHIDKVKECFDRFEMKRLTNEEAMEVIFGENKVISYLSNNIRAGRTMAAFVNSINKKIGCSHKAYL